MNNVKMPRCPRTVSGKHRFREVIYEIVEWYYKPKHWWFPFVEGWLSFGHWGTKIISVAPECKYCELLDDTKIKRV